MLLLSRKPGEKIRIGDDIVITVVETHGNRVRLSIDAPSDCRITRDDPARRAASAPQHRPAAALPVQFPPDPVSPIPNML